MNPHAELLKSILMSDDAYERGITKRVAEEACTALSTVYTACDGRNNPSVEIIRAAFVVTNDPRLKGILEPRGWELVRCRDAVCPQHDVEGEAIDVTSAVCKLVEDNRHALAHGRLGRKEQGRLVRDLLTAELRMSELKAALLREIEEAEKKDAPGLKVAGQPS